MSENNLTIVSALVLVDQDRRVLICERPKGKFMEGFWEFPGGKLEIHTPQFPRRFAPEIHYQTFSCSALAVGLLPSKKCNFNKVFDESWRREYVIFH